MNIEEKARPVFLFTRVENGDSKNKKSRCGYKQGRRPLRVVARDIDVSLRRGEFVCLLGPNGAGKSTLIRTLVGMQPSLDGRVYLMGRDYRGYVCYRGCQVISVVLTDRIGVGIMAVRDLVGLGRYPHTNWIGRFTEEDERVVSWAIRAAALRIWHIAMWPNSAMASVKRL